MLEVLYMWHELYGVCELIVAYVIYAFVLHIYRYTVYVLYMLYACA